MTLAAVPRDAVLHRDGASAVAARLVAGVEQVVHGRRRQVELVVCAVLAGGHAADPPARAGEAAEVLSR